MKVKSFKEFIKEKTNKIEEAKDVLKDTPVKKVKRKTQDLKKFVTINGKKYKIPTSAKNSKFEEFAKMVIKNMFLQMKGQAASRLMLTGAPGTGKTSALYQLSVLFGMNLVILEASQMTEEQFISIPYILFKNGKKTEEELKYNKTGDGTYELINAESALASKLEKLKPIPENLWKQQLQKNKILKKIYDENQKYIDLIRMKTQADKSGYKAILFIDEYFRASDVKILNLLRTILNGRIGNSKIPEGLYIITASNVDNSDGSLSDIPMNQQFTVADFDEEYKPTKDDFLNYIANKYIPQDEDDASDEDEVNKPENKEPMKPEVYNAFAETIGDEMNKASNDVRLSSRRLEQMMIYVNDRIPVQSQADADALMKYIKIQLTDYLTGEVSAEYKKYSDMTKKLILETSGIKAKVAPDIEWENVLTNEIQAQINIGKDRTYPLVLSGAPGVGKTSSIIDVAKKNHMGLIDIDASTLTIDDTVGIPIPEEKGKTIETKFSKPPLYVRIMEDYDKEIKKLKKKKIDLSARKYNVILFIDEISRTKIDIFNKIRILMLEKKVGTAEYKLPDDVMILSALNPDNEGAQELPEHFKDVLDIIPVKLSVKKMEKYLKSLKVFNDNNTEVGFSVSDLSLNVLQKIYNRFKSDIDIYGNPVEPEVQPFYWQAGANIIYISPREISEMYQQFINNVSIDFDMNGWNDVKELDKNTIKKFIDIAKKDFYSVISDNLKFVFLKHQIEIPDRNKFLKVILKIIDTSSEFEEVIVKKKSESLENFSFSSILARGNIDEVIKEGTPLIKQWLESVNDYSEVTTDVNQAIIDYFRGHTATESLEFLVKLSRLFDAIKFDEIPQGKAIEDQIFSQVFNKQLNGLISREDFLEAYADDENDIIDKTIDEIQDIVSKHA